MESQKDYQLARNRIKRIIKPPQRLGHADLISYAFSVASQICDDEPVNLIEAMRSEAKEKWYQAMAQEMEFGMKSDLEVSI